jgi:steroid delta-isomerase-like uncharacterized protein
MGNDNAGLILRHHDEVWSKGDLSAVDELYAADFVGHHPGQPDWIGPESVKRVVIAIREAFPDFRESVEDVLVEGDKVATRFTSTGTHLGAYREFGPTGRRVALTEMGFFRVSGGRIVEKWGLLDRVGMFQQLGMVPATWPPMELLYTITMDAEVHDIGMTPCGHRRVVVVKGGTFEGPKLKGTVLPGGGDWLVERADGSRALDVRITLRTDDAALIYAHYPGRFYCEPAVTQRLLRGDPVDPSEDYFRTAPFFETASPKYGWLNRIMAVGIGTRAPTTVSYTVYVIL